jgi:hypothetical protein
VSYWHLGEAAGNAADSKGTNTGVYTGSPTLNQTTLVTGGDGSVSLSGTGQYIAIAGGVSLQPVSPTYEVWVNLTTLASKNTGSFADDCFGLSFDAAGHAQANFWNGATNRTTVGTTALSTSTKYHLAASFNDTTGDLIIYVNGVADGTSNFIGQHIGWDATTTSALGGGMGGTTPVAGRIDEAAFYNVAVPAVTLLAHYNKGK